MIVAYNSKINQKTSYHLHLEDTPAYPIEEDLYISVTKMRLSSISMWGPLLEHLHVVAWKVGCRDRHMIGAMIDVLKEEVDQASGLGKFILEAQFGGT